MEVSIFLVVSTRTPGKTKKAGYKYILACKDRTLTGGGEIKSTTGHRLIMSCLIEALKRMTRPSMITVYTDCRYLINNFQHLQEWQTAGWRRQGGELKNVDLWQQIEQLARGHAIRWVFENMDKYR